MSAMLSLKDVVKQLGVQGYQIQHAIFTGAVPETRLRIGGRRVFEPVDMERLAAHFGAKIAAATAAEPVEA